MRKKRDKDDSSALGSDFEQWSSKRGEILARYTTTEKLSIVSGSSSNFVSDLSVYSYPVTGFRCRCFVTIS